MCKKKELIKFCEIYGRLFLYRLAISADENKCLAQLKIITNFHPEKKY